MASPLKVGTVKKLNHPQGLGEGIGHVPHGSEFKVVEVVEPGTPGVGDHEEDTHTVIVAFDEPSIVINDEGYAERGSVTRHLSMSLSKFNELTGDNNAG